jgi:hypothetical protein
MLSAPSISRRARILLLGLALVIAWTQARPVGAQEAPPAATPAPLSTPAPQPMPPPPLPLAAPRLIPVAATDAAPPRPAPYYKSALFWTSIVVGAAVVGAITWGAVWAATRETRYAVVEF